MSVLIKGMDMPNDCCQCKLARYDDYENETFCPFTDVMCLSIGRQDNCPLEEVPSAQPEPCKDAVSRNAIIRVLNSMDRYVSSELTFCDTDKKFPKNEVFVVDDVYEEIVEKLPSVRSEPDWNEIMVICDNCGHAINIKRENCKVSAQPDSTESSLTQKALDTIDRQAAIDAIRKEYGGIRNANMDGDFLADEIEFILSKIPSAQPIIRCKDCKHRYIDDSVWKCPYGYPYGDFYCAYGEERRTDE